MKRFMHIRTLLLLVSALLAGAAELHAQMDLHYNGAYSFIQRGEVDSARKEIDLCFTYPEAAADPQVLYLKGFIYKELYKKYENTDFNSAFRDQAFEGFKKSMAVDTVAQRRDGTRASIRYLAGRYYNDAVATLDTVHFTTALACYQKYREAALLDDPKFDVKKKDIEFYLALASTYDAVYSGDKKKNAKYFDLTRETYLQVLAWDANNYTANYNLGLLFWNKGVDLMYDVDYDVPLDSVMLTQDKSVELFKQSLPFAEKAYEKEPKREETLIVLSGIYYSLNDFQKSKDYQEMLENLRKQK